MDDSIFDTKTNPVSVSVIPGGAVTGVIQPPGSKSLTNRALICAAFADGTSTLRGTLSSEDTHVMAESLRGIGVVIEHQKSDSNHVVDATKRSSHPHWTETSATSDPAASDPATSDPIEMFIANSGTSVRFLTAALSASGGSFLLSGVPRMHQRPIGDLAKAISGVIDGSISTESANACPPVRLQGNGWSGKTVKVAGSVSSQFLSGLMMAAPVAAQIQGNTVEVRVEGELVSRPYVDMTQRVMQDFGASIRIVDDADGLSYQVDPIGYQATDYRIEPDASAASYFWAAAAITAGKVTVKGLNRKAMQGDVGFVDVLQQMGCEVVHADDAITVIGHSLSGVDVDMNAISDTVQTLAVVALFASGPTRVRGVAHNRYKETDRIGDLATELRKLGAKIDEHQDGLTIHPLDQKSLQRDASEPAILETYHDHRMAMSLSLAGLRVSGVRILDPSCTSKTYPDFFHDLEKLTGRAHAWT